jgi:SWI/SNF-related matrix-associated actin-dependent regulator 1 of chromatin subfamily A
MSAVELNLETLAQWGPPERLQTKFGPRIKRAAKTMPPDFWDLWRGHKEALKAAGLSPSKDQATGAWSLTWWQPLPAEEQAERAANLEASKAEAADVSIPLTDWARDNSKDYFPFQKAGIGTAVVRLRPFTAAAPGRGVLFGDEMGLGKTLQGIGVVNLMPQVHTVLLEVPSSLKINWRNEIGKWLARDFYVTILDGTKPIAGLMAHLVTMSYDVRIVVVNYDILHAWVPELSTVHWDLRMRDEAHKLKNPKARRTIAAMAVVPTYKIDITGTPIPNVVMEGYGLFSDLDPVEFGNQRQFKSRYAYSTANLGELQQRLRSTILIRRLKRDVLKELPAKMRQVIELPVTEATRAVLAAELAAANVHEARLSELKAAVELAKVSESQEQYEAAVAALREGVRVAFTEIALVRHATAVAKIPDVIRHVESIVEEGLKVVVFAYHRDVIQAIRDHFGAAFIWGGMSNEAKEAQKDRFMTDPACMVFVGQYEAAGVGHTLTVSSRFVAAELEWVPGNMSQAEDRIHRIGQEERCLFQHLVLEGSLDATMARRLVAKQDVIDRTLDDPVTAQEAQEPVSFVKSEISVTRKEVAEAPEFAEPLRAAIHLGLQMLAGVCDGAHSLDGAGFNKFDSSIGKSLAMAPRLTNKQCVLGRKLVTKYRRQLPEGLLEVAP